MALVAGSRLGAYEITGPLGAGGMGEVYRARDTHLGREVAIKTLASQLAADQDRLARFEREAKLLAALNHPHIAAVYGLDRHEGTLYLALELVEGQTLEQRLTRGALPAEDALRIGLQIAEALEAAHGKGVVHRDLKPANVMLTPDDQVKVLDFGLAKAFSGNPGEASPAHSPTLSVAMTQQGLVLGTAAYMAPEQASGQAADQRADIWAFGVVLFEMLTGLPAFRGESVPHILADVLKSEPDWQRLPQGLNPRVKLLLQRCLTKRPRSRWHSMADVRIEIEAMLADPQGAEFAPAVAPRGAWLWQVAAGGVLVAVLAALGGWLARPAAETLEPAPVVRFSIPVDEPWDNTPSGLIAIAPDGSRIAYVVDRELYVRNLDEAEARPVPGTANRGSSSGTMAPVFSPDGEWLAYVSSETDIGPSALERVPVGGGAAMKLHVAVTIADTPTGLSWPTSDALIFADRRGIVRLPVDGGEAEVLVPAGDNEHFDSPQLLPGGDAVLFTRLTEPAGVTAVDLAAAQVVVQSIGGSDRRVLLPASSAARYLPSGHLVYAQGGALFAVAFDTERLELRGGSVPMLQGLRRANRFSDAANFGVSDTGTLAMIPAGGTAEAPPIQATLAWVDRNGEETPLTIRSADYTQARLSPDGSRLALLVGSTFNRPTQRTSLWVYDFEANELRQLTTDPVVPDNPMWSEDGTQIFFRWLAPRGFEIHSIDVATGETRQLSPQRSSDFPFALPWARVPGQNMLAIVYNANADFNIGTLSLDTGELRPLLDDPEQQMDPTFFPDGSWFAYTERASLLGAGEIVIRPFPAVSRNRIVVGPGVAPVISRDGSELFFFDQSGIAVASLSHDESTVRVGTPRRLFESNAYMWADQGRAWDPDPTGQRFIVIRNPAGATTSAPAPEEPARIDVVLNWFEELESRVPTK
jgi:eukaryotic-like serine/threonine-protein kinase